MMMNATHILILADAYKTALGIEDKTVSSRVFDDSKKLTAIRFGSDLTLSRFNAALRWFDANWPEGVEWPETVLRPATVERFDRIFDADRGAV
ncbi:hypothetical protein [Phyllobacterium leguminum]|uniref:Uncharacterized protein n=1 Tax=Phyllobacterium leguminum TaxID=314237 RepID=A0A318T5R4_9HYPH|nr:hypothetical protein [Phyllobacterium leguminum]PYE89624.1 hypothetical protein C7477_103132 [Phyllobacterium leguminum]